MRRIISVLLENEPGALSRIMGLFSQRGYNVDSLCVSTTTDPSLSRITITTSCDDKVIEQITKQINKLVDVFKVMDLTEGNHLERELMLIKIATPTEQIRAEVKRNADIFRGSILDVSAKNYTIQLTGPSDKLDAFISTTADYTDVIEVSRTGACGLSRGDRALKI